LNPNQISTGQRRFTFEERPDIVPLFENYSKLLFQNNHKSIVNYSCYFVDFKEKLDREHLQNLIKSIPIYKKIIGKIVRIIIKRFKIILDYSTLIP
jgi:hypothetical protein